MTYRVEFAPEVEEQIATLYHYIATEAAPAVAASFTEAVLTHCEELATFPERGIKRDDIRPGLRVTNYKKRTCIAFFLEGDTVLIVGMFHGGQDYAAILGDDPDDGTA